MRNLNHKVGDVVFMSGKASSIGKGMRGTVTKITAFNTHLNTGYCRHRFIMELPTAPATGPAQVDEHTYEPADEPTDEPRTQDEIIRNLARLIIKLTEKVSSLESEIKCLKTEVREAIFTI